MDGHKTQHGNELRLYDCAHKLGYKQSHCTVPLNTLKMYKRKTKERFFIGHQVGFDGKKEIMQWDFETEADCDKKLAELNTKHKASQDNPIIDPFSQFNRWWKVRNVYRYSSTQTQST